MEFNNYGLNINQIFFHDARNPDLPVVFDAFLTSFNSSITATWNEEAVYGRQDVIGTYQGTKRKISFGINAVSYDVKSAKENMEKINKLTLMLYPSYNSSQTTITQVQPPLKENEISVSTNALTLSKVPLVYLKFGNLIHENGDIVLGWINSFTANPVLDMGMFIDKAVSGFPYGNMYPKIWDISIDFTPQHQQMIGGTKNNPEGLPDFPYDLHNRR